MHSMFTHTTHLMHVTDTLVNTYIYKVHIHTYMEVEDLMTSLHMSQGPLLCVSRSFPCLVQRNPDRHIGSVRREGIDFPMLWL